MIWGIILFLVNGGVITGKVTQVSGAPINNVYLKAYDEHTHNPVAYAITGSDGIYYLTSLPTGSYKVRTFNNQGYTDVYYPDAINWTDGIPVPVTSGDTTQDIDFILERGGCAAGKVLAEDSVTPIQSTILVYDTSSQQVIADGQTLTDGTYLITQLPAVGIKIRTWDFHGYIDMYYDNTIHWDSATIISINPPDTVFGINFFLAQGGKIEGIIRDTDSLPLNGIDVKAYSSFTHEFVSRATSGSDGMYILEGLPTGEYKLLTENQKGYIDVYYENAFQWDSATPVSVQSPDTTWDINFVIRYGSSILGEVVDSVTYTPLKDIGVTIYDAVAESLIKSSVTDSMGWYLINGLPTGAYKVKTKNYKNYIDVYYPDAIEWDSALVINLLPPDTAQLDFKLKLGGCIKGYVYDPYLSTFPGTYVHAFYSNTGELIRSDQVKSDGSYIVFGLPTYCFKVFVAGGERNDTAFAFEWFQDKNSWDLADTVCIITPGDTVPNVNFKLDIGGSISGYVYTVDSFALSGAIVNGWVYWGPKFGRIKWESAHTMSDGSYILKGLRTGEYLVSASKSGYETRWYDDVPDSSLATPVAVVMPDTTPGIDFYLPYTGVEEVTKCGLQITELISFPNPFTTITTIVYKLVRPQEEKSLNLSTYQPINLFIYDLSGRLIRGFRVNRLIGRVIWDARDNQGREVGSGIYFYQLKAGGRRLTKKLVLIR